MLDDLLQIQIQLEPNGWWHRRNRVVAMMTACGQYVTGPVLSRDSNKGDNHLCPICFSRDEIDTQKMRKLERALEIEESFLYHDEDEDPTDPDVVLPLPIDDENKNTS